MALSGLTVSYLAPYAGPSSDEIVYMTGALQARDHNLPDAYMLHGDDYGPYLYPKVLLASYGTLGYDLFKSIYVVVLILVTGLSAYAMFRMLWLPWVPALLFSLVALMPRFAAGLEIFGAFTFRDAIGRQSALPLFFLATGFLVRRFVDKKSLWPVFGIIGLCVFLHPVTVMLFAFASLLALGIARIVERRALWRVVVEVLVCGITFVLGGAYLFVEVFARLFAGAAVGASSSTYIQAVLLRNAWDFPQGSLLWWPHMAIVSALFVLVLLAFYALPRLRAVRLAYPMPHSQTIVVWGLSVAVVALVASVALPGINFYFMEHSGAPYIFQQWSRIAKFYYFGLFVALIPAVYAGWHWYRASRARFKVAVLVVLVVAGLLSSSFGFEVAQYVVGYKDYERAYIPQALSGAPDATRPAQYQEACDALMRLGAKPDDEIISGNFAFRFFCRANLYVTNEEGAAYTQLTRDDLTDWYTRLEAQREAFKGGNPAKAFAFVRQVGAKFAILLDTATTTSFKSPKNSITTSRYIVVRVP